MNVIAEAVRTVYAQKGYTFLDDGSPYRLNIFGVRNYGPANKFSDFLCVCFRNSSSEWVLRQWPGTTMPGLSMLRGPVNPKGTAILVPGQYVDAYKKDLHAGKYEALCQRLKPVRVFRDANRDTQYDLDPATIQEGMFGINIHKAGTLTESVDRYSAGCQVFQREADFNLFMLIVESAIKRESTSFTYTLFEKSDFA